MPELIETELDTTMNNQAINPSINTDINQWTVLVVDDEQDTLVVVERILRFYGAQVYTARNGELGLSIINTIEPTFVLLDLSMPKMDGWAMVSAMRGNPDSAHLPVIALSGAPIEGERDRLFEAGFDGFIAKPFRMKTFIEQIQDILQPFTVSG